MYEEQICLFVPVMHNVVANLLFAKSLGLENQRVIYFLQTMFKRREQQKQDFFGCDSGLSSYVLLSHLTTAAVQHHEL